MKESYINNIKKYYKDNLIFYKLFWGNKRNLSMHYGYWDKDTKNLHEAFINENKSVADALEIKKDDIVLDSGCGMGGTALWMAENFNVKVTGINIMEDQIKLAKKYAAQRGLEYLTTFEVRDFHKTGYSDNSFDKIYAIESSSHSYNKLNFVKEAYRILKPGGKIIIIDGFLGKDKLKKRDKELYNTFCNGLALPNLASVKEFNEYLQKTGFKNIKYINETIKVMPSSIKLYKSAKVLHPLSKLLKSINLTSEANIASEKAVLIQKYLFDSGTGVYMSFIAEK